MRIYELWEVRTNNLIATFDSEGEALAMLREAIREQGERVVEFVMLVEDDYENDSWRHVGIGMELVDCVTRIDP